MYPHRVLQFTKSFMCLARSLTEGIAMTISQEILSENQNQFYPQSEVINLLFGGHT